MSAESVSAKDAAEEIVNILNPNEVAARHLANWFAQIIQRAIDAEMKDKK